MVGYTGDMEKSLVDPTAGSGPFLTQALKRIIASRGGVIKRDDMEQITRNVVGFDINPISVVAAKANYILILFSAYRDDGQRFGNPVTIPVFIADSILAPVVYAEESGQNLEIRTSVGKLTLPKFVDFQKGNEFLSLLSRSIHEKARWETFQNVVLAKRLISKKDIECVKILFDQLYVLHRSGCDSFWPIILRNSYAPIMIGNKFDFVVGNPPWISWKAMSKSYREGTLKIWWSYEIFEKNAYDKKTTHDDFGMAVTYVAMDQYLKNGGSMVFLLPASFLKSTKGGEGFRKFRIIRNGQDIPFSVDAVHDFSGVKLFTVPTSAVRFMKGTEMRYPMHHYRFYTQTGSRSKIDPHWTWNQVAAITKYNDQIARPIDLSQIQSAWLTLGDMTFADKLTDKSKPRYYCGRKGVEPAGAKGVYILEKPIPESGGLVIRNDISRQRRMDVVEKGVNEGIVERDFIYPMLGGRNIARWKVKSTEYMIVPHTAEHKYGVPESILSKIAPNTFLWLEFYREKLLETRVRNGKFFNPKTNPFYRLDNVGPYTFSPYKVLWKEQAASMSAVVVHTYLSSIPDADPAIFPDDKPIVVDSKVLMLGLDDEMEAYYVCGVINARSVIKVVDGYAIGTNRGVDVLKNVAVPKFNHENPLHYKIATLSKQIHENATGNLDIEGLETSLDKAVCGLFEIEGNANQPSLNIGDAPEEGDWKGRMAAFEEADA